MTLVFAFADVDASYGRIDGDVAIATSAGVDLGPRVVGDARVRYLQTAGIFGTIEGGPTALPRRVIAFGAETRPLFIARWATGHELERPRLDMLIDSFALELGVAFVHPGEASLQAGVGLELPFFAEATGPFVALHAGGRWSEAALAGNSLGSGDRAFYLAVTLGWQQIFPGHLVELREVRP